MTPFQRCPTSTKQTLPCPEPNPAGSMLPTTPSCPHPFTWPTERVGQGNPHPPPHSGLQSDSRASSCSGLQGDSVRQQICAPFCVFLRHKTKTESDKWIPSMRGKPSLVSQQQFGKQRVRAAQTGAPLWLACAHVWVWRMFAGKCSAGFSTTFACRRAVADERWFLRMRQLLQRGPPGLTSLHDWDQLMGPALARMIVRTC
jgi:hypothetical protein